MPRRRPKNRGGRPSKWTPEVIIPLALALRDGWPMTAAAKRAGVGKSTVNRWLAASRSGDPRFAALIEHAKLLKLDQPAADRW
jgi:hypothetical protein